MLLQLSVLSLILLASAASAQPCAPSSCGNVTNIRFPFYIPALQPSRCGLPGFQLNCTNLGLPIFRTSPDNHEYVVESISDTDPIVRLYDAALLTFNDNTTCLPQLTNVTQLPTPQLRYFNTTSLHLFPLCLRNSTTGLWPYRVICGVQDDARIWNLAIYDGANPAHLTAAVENCETHIVAPVNFGDDNIYLTLRRGFQLRWTTGDANLEPSPEPNFSAPPPLADQGAGKEKGSTPLVLVTGVSVASLIVVVSFILLIFFRKKLLKSLGLGKEDGENQVDIELYLKNHGNLAPKRYKYSHLKKMTNSFAENLGKGGYGSVYKGKLQDGLLVAVKILNESEGNGEEFINEVSSISRTSHVNVVALLGFCFEGSKRALIYEFMPNGSLEKFLPDTSSSTPKLSLGLVKLFEIAVGIARGLEYLHQGCNTRILHFDIKPHNILLDKDLKPKIADFGLSKLCPNRSSIVSMKGARGTAGYIAPEVFCRNFGEVSHKSDVYSYGMMVLEMVVGRQNNNIVSQGGRSSEMSFSDWIFKSLEQNTVGEGILDDTVSQENEWNSLKRKLIIIGLLCIQTDPKNRPSINGVMEMLEAKIESLQLPPRPNLSLQSPLSRPILLDSKSKSLL
ncbi:PR5-like receptor kinase [Henckelia pumila]|uniref:PR5-like receptor kinase n=1 Tax=Henckelia pumila TaxID=405737 RepID=UPI003C6DD9B7